MSQIGHECQMACCPSEDKIKYLREEIDNKQIEINNLNLKLADMTLKVAAYKMESEADQRELDGANSRCKLLEKELEQYEY